MSEAGQNIAKKKTIYDIVSIYSLFVVRNIVPIILISIYANSISQVDFAIVVTAQSVAMMASQFIDFGFSLTALRAISSSKTEEIPELASAIFSAQLIISLLCLAGIPLVALTSPVLYGDPLAIAFCIIFAVLAGLNWGWYFYGRGRGSFVVKTELLATLVTLAVTSVLVLKYENANAVLIGLLAGPTVSFSIFGIAFIKQVTPRFKARRGLAQLRAGLPVFLSRVGVILYTTASVWIASLLLPVGQLAIYGGSIRIVSALCGLFLPAAQIMLPIIMKLRGNPGAEGRVTRIIFVVFLTTAIAMVAAVLVSADWMSEFVLDNQESGMAMRILAIMLPMVAVSTFLSNYIIIPNNLDRYLPYVSISAGVAITSAAAVAGTYVGLYGIISARLVGEAFVLLSYLFIVRNLATHHRRTS